MKVIIQIPCFNEQETLESVFLEMPKAIEGVDCIEYLVIDDCCTDKTVEVAKKLGVHHIIHIKDRNCRWLGRTFRAGVHSALQLGADILVNTDGDNQYPSSQICNLVKPILEGKADLVIGDRNPGHLKSFSLPKRALQILGNHAVSLVAGKKVFDSVSGFRAYSRSSLLALELRENYSYTIESLVQLIRKGFRVDWIRITPNPATRESRLIVNIFEKSFRGGMIIFRLCLRYRLFDLVVVALTTALILILMFSSDCSS